MNPERVAIIQALDLKSIKRQYDLGLRSKFFVDPVYREVYDKMVDYWSANHMERTYTLDMLETDFPGQEWREDLAPEESPDWVVTNLKNRYTANRIQSVILDAATEATDGSPQVALTRLNESVVEIQRETAERLSRVDLSKNVDERRARYASRTGFEGDVKGVPFGFRGVTENGKENVGIDEHTFGLLPGELAAVVAYSGVGKSTFLVNSFVEARRAGYTPILFTLELSVHEMADKVDAKISGLPHMEIQRGTLGRGELQLLLDAQDRFSSLGEAYIEKPPRGERGVQALVNRAREVGADFMLIDQLSFMEPKKNHQKRHEAIEDIMFDLKAEISEDEAAMIPCLIAAQFNRDSMTTRKGRGGLHQIALSSSIEQCVDMAFGLHASMEDRANNKMIIDALKLRRGTMKSWLVDWHMNSMTQFGPCRDYMEVD